MVREMGGTKKNGKQGGLSVSAAAISPTRTRRLFIYDKKERHQFLIDTGADVSVLPARKEDREHPTDYKLYAANGTEINTYGEHYCELSLDLRRALPWRFIVTDVPYPIIGADFLIHYALLPDLRNRRLVDGLTLMYVKCSLIMTTHPTVTTVDTSAFAKLLAEFRA